MSLRSKSRAHALQMLFQWEISREDPKAIEARFWQMARAEKTTREFAEFLFEGTAASATDIDQALTKHAENWRIERMATIDRAILRLGAFELATEKTPPKVVINEAVELAKQFSSEDSAAFVNGVLDSLLRGRQTKAKGSGGAAG
jgi:N utilization substance protein B